MVDRYVKTEHVGYGARVKNAFSGILVGIVFIVGSVILLWWNEGRMVKTSRALAEGAAAVVDADVAGVDAAKDGKLVHVAGRVQAADDIADPALGISTGGLALKRTVEMYQWHGRLGNFVTSAGQELLLVENAIVA